MKNVLIINSTYRKGGNSEALAEQFATGAREAGNTVKTVNLRDMELKFCIGCLSCLKTGKCIHNDGINELLPVISSADVLVFATPVYYYSISGQLKTLIDRINPLYGKNNKFRAVYLIASSADENKTAMDGAIKATEGFIECFNDAYLGGVIYGTGADAIGTVQNKAVFKEAYELGKSIK